MSRLTQAWGTSSELFSTKRRKRRGTCRLSRTYCCPVWWKPTWSVSVCNRCTRGAMIPSRPALSSKSRAIRSLRLMWIVKLALRRPYTFVVMALLILLLGVSAIKTTPTDIFPEIDIPVVTVVWQYTGLSPDQMAKQITTFSEYTISSAVDNVKNIESQTLAGVSVIRIFFQPNVRIDSAIAQVTAVSQTILRRMPPGAQPPFIIRYTASSVPILPLALGGRTRTKAQLYDTGIYRVRQAIAPVRGATLPL